MRLLAVDTSTATGGIAVLDGHTVRAVIHTTSGHTHARRLMATVDAALTLAGMTMDDIDAFAVTTGPGSFTGLRIGIGAVKGFALARSRPVAAVSTLDVLARQFPPFDGKVCPVLDARKGQVYTALYECGDGENWAQIRPPCVIDPAIWLKELEGPCLFVGDGLNTYRPLVEAAFTGTARCAPAHLNTPNACVVGWIAKRDLEAGNGVDVARLSPDYIRKSDAEIKLEKGLVGSTQSGNERGRIIAS
jgi:tRNA threonylcarbamoyladenosine biosynthesis protein TsaB